jgi:CheY-like chemotaxis protein
MKPLHIADAIFTGRGAEASPPVVLIVDDEPAVRALLARALGVDGYELLLAESASEALELMIRTGSILSVAVVDLHLGETDGVSLAQLLRRMQPGLTVLFTTGYGEEEQVRVPHDPLLPKPFPPATIAQCVRDLLATGRCACCDRLAGGA